MENLRPRERKVLDLRFGLTGSGTHSLRQIGHLLRISKERVRQIQNRALEKLRASAERVGWERACCSLIAVGIPIERRSVGFPRSFAFLLLRITLRNSTVFKPGTIPLPARLGRGRPHAIPASLTRGDSMTEERSVSFRSATLKPIRCPGSGVAPSGIG